MDRVHAQDWGLTWRSSVRVWRRSHWRLRDEVKNA